jgi:hypothetical protein
MRTIVLVLLLVAVALPAFPINLGSEIVVIPVIGRFAGANSTQWRTDVFIANPFSPVQIVTLRFYVTGSGLQTRTVTLQPFSNVTLTDIVLNTYGLSSAAGVLEIVAPGTILARARIYNRGNAAGEFGQSVQGIGQVYLNRQAFMHGLSGINGNRVNIGAANPNDAPTSVTTVIRDENSNIIHSRSDNVGPHQYMQINDIFTAFGIAPRAGIVISMSSDESLRIYGYASEVRNDTGDAVFVFGTSPNS